LIHEGAHPDHYQPMWAEHWVYIMHLAVLTAPDLTLISLALREKLEARAPSTLNTTASVCGGTTNILQEAVV